jgi:flagellar basal-body rod protein FlgG
MSAEQSRTDVIGNNIANLNTTGFKRSTVLTSEFSQMLLYRLGDAASPSESAPAVGRIGFGATVAQVAADTAQGAVVGTDQPLDVALQGPGEFQVLGPGGTVGTRDGAFHRDSAGRLVTAQGFAVLVNGAPVGQGAADLVIREDGTVFADGKPVGTIDISGSNQPVRLAVRSLERSNVDLSQEMTDLIVALRSFQANQRALQAQDETLGRAVEEIGRV